MIHKLGVNCEILLDKIYFIIYYPKLFVQIITKIPRVRIFSNNNLYKFQFIFFHLI